MGKKKPRGHYCKVCGERKSNESFTGKGHAVHICKACFRFSPEQQAEQIALNRLVGMAGRHLNESEIRWLRNRTRDTRQQVRELATLIYEEKFHPEWKLEQEDDLAELFDSLE